MAEDNTPTNVVDDAPKSLQQVYDNLYNKPLKPGGVEANQANSFSKLRPDGTKVVVHFSLVNEILDNYGLEKTQLGAWENEADNVLDIILDTQYKILKDKGIQESPRGFFGGSYTSVSPEEFKQIIPKLNNYFLGKEVLLDSEDYLDESGEGLKLKYKGNPIVPTDTPTNVVDEVSKLQDNINDYLNEIISENPSRSADLAVDPLRLTLSDDGKFIDITELVIDENYRNQGLGTEVFNRIKEFANNNNLSITTTPFVGELENLVKKQGFVKEGNQYILKLDTPGGSLGAAKLNDPLVFDSWIDNYAKTTTSFVDNLPLSTTVKNQFNNLVQGRARNLATPGGVADAVDVWELGVLGLMIAAVAYKEYDEIPTILTNKGIDMFNAMTGGYGIPPIPKEEYNLDYEFINKVVETGEKVMPTDIFTKKVVEIAKGVGEKGLATGFGYVPTTPKNTDTMETTQKIQPGVREEKMFEQLKPKKIKSAGGSGARIQ